MAGLLNRLVLPKSWTPSRYRALLRARGPRSTQFRTRGAILFGAILIGIAATLFAEAADWAAAVFSYSSKTWHWMPLVTTPLTFMGLVWVKHEHFLESSNNLTTDLEAGLPVLPMADVQTGTLLHLASCLFTVEKRGRDE